MAVTASVYEILLLTISFLLLLIYFKAFKTDTNVESMFFTVDTSRTMRFMISYMVVLNVAIIGVYILLPFLLFGLTVVLFLIVFLVGNILIFLLNLILFLVATTISFIAVSSLSSLSQSNIESFFTNYYELGFEALQVLIYIFPPIFAGRQIGKYAEDKKSILIIGITWYLFLTSLVYSLLAFDSTGLLLLDWIWLIIIADLGIYYLTARTSYNNKMSIENYDLLEIKGLSYNVYFIVGLIPLIIALGFIPIVFGFGFILVYFTDGSNIFESYEILNIVITGISLLVNVLFTVLAFFFYIRRDHPLEQKITELEIREELLEMAKEFRELDPSNIEDFARQTGSKMI